MNRLLLNSYRIMAIAAIAVILVSCTGAEGPAGPKGRDGEDGNANVNSMVFTITPSNWVKADEKGVWYVDVNAPLIDSYIMDYGAVIFYLKDIGGFNSWLSLPFTNVNYYQDSIEYLTIYEPWYDLGNLHIQWRDTHPVNPQPPDWDCVFKVVIIDGYPGLARKLESIDVSDYQQVKSEFRLED